MTDLELLNSLWQGCKLLRDPRLLVDLILLPNGEILSDAPKHQIDLIAQSGMVSWVQIMDMAPKDQPGVRLTDLGLKAIGKPTKAESMMVEVSGPDIRKVRKR